MTKIEQLKQDIAELKAAMVDDESKEQLAEPLKEAEKQLAELEKAEKEKKEKEKQQSGEKKDKEKSEKEKKEKEEKEKKEKEKQEKEKKEKEEKKKLELTPEQIKTAKEFFEVLGEPLFVEIKKQAKKTEKKTKVKPHSQSYKHAKRIAENIPKVFRPAMIEISKSSKKDKNKALIKETEKMVDFLTIFANDLDLLVLTEDVNAVKKVNNYLLEILKKTHQNNFKFKYDGRARIKELAKKYSELSVVKFACGGSITE